MRFEHLQPFPVAQRVALPIPPGKGDHLAVYRDFCDALQGKGATVTGEEARKSLEVANSLIYSGETNQAVELPLDRGRYARLLRALQQRSATPHPQDVPVELATPGIK